MAINPEVPAAGVPPLTRAGLHHNFTQARAQLLEHMGRMDGMHTRIQVLEAAHGGDIGGILTRIQMLEAKAALHDLAIEDNRNLVDRLKVKAEMHDGLIVTLEGNDAVHARRLSRHRLRIRALENAVIRILLHLLMPLSWLRSTP